MCPASYNLLMAQPFDVCIRGAGIVGRTLALLLARDRLRVALVDTSAPAHPASVDVRAYALNPVSRTLLDDLRCWPDAQHATAVAAMQVFGDQGGEVNFRAAENGAEALAWVVDVPALERQLSEAVRYQPMVQIVATPQPAALTVICEGKTSATRQELGVAFSQMPYHQHAVAARVTCALPHGQVARQWFSDGEVLALLPLDGAQGNSVAVVWSVQQERAPALLALPPEEFTQALEQASHSALGAMQLQSERASWPLQNGRAERWTGQYPAEGRKPPKSWALAGDAAHTIHPLAGQGLNLGLGDAAELASLLHDRDYWRSVGDEKLLRRYERARKAALLAVGGTSDGLQQLFAQDAELLRGLRNWGMKGFERSGLLKTWVARQAMGTHR